ncbi:AsmA family protein [Mangrovimonas cancribranchiae]|uniref:AsmA-like C-terminal region-containing protein n=1 Tax=Mangrovimonas cancribranchiae TaxID=3080055 RepID=A0AAU6P587_9FLAO
MKKALKILGITLGIIFLLLLAIPFVFQGQIKDMVKTFLNQNLNAQVEFSDVDLSFIRSFPQAYANVDDLTITNKKPFEGETLATVKSIAFTMSIKELFKTANEDAIVINSINIDEALVTLKTNTLGQTNYDIALENENIETTTEDTNSDSSFAFDIEDYAITNSALTYIDESSKTEFFITELNHEGKGTFSAEKSELNTNTEANVSLSLDSTKYLNNNHIKLEAILGLDLENQKYTFKDNKAYINQLPLEFDGFVQLLDEGQNMDITFKNPGSSFKDFLAVIPENYSKDISNVETTGNFKISGVVKGMITEKTIPTMDINIVSNNASFKYPDLPKSIKNISINTSIKNTSGNLDDTFVDIQTLNFKIDEDVFKSSAVLKNITQNMLVNANIDGTLNLGNITKAYPVELDNELTGILKGNINTNFDMNAIETNAYNRIKNNGTVSISDFIFSSEDIVNPIEITQANIDFKPGTITLKNFNASTGQSDLHATGTIENLLGFLLSDKKLQGNFNVNSNNFVVSDFMVPDEETGEDNKTTGESESLKIPDFLDCTINADAKEVVYNNLTLKDVKGSLVIKDQQASLNNMTSQIFNGGLSINGLVDTKNDTPTFNLDLGADNFDISQSFKDLELLQVLAPIANVLQGKLNSTLHLSGDLDSEFSPKLTSISGDAFAELLTKEITTENSPLLSKLESNVDFIDFKKLNLNDLKANLEFNNGQVNVKPFNVKYEDIDIQVSGAHSFDKAIDYNVVFQVPAKYLGSDVNRLIGKIDDKEVNNLSIPVTANIGGSFTSPTVKTDLSSAATNLTNQLIEIQKQKLLNQGSNTIKDLLGGINNNQETETPTNTNSTNTTNTTNTNNNTVEEGVKNLIGNIFGKKKQTKDSVN